MQTNNEVCYKKYLCDVFFEGEKINSEVSVYENRIILSTSDNKSFQITKENINGSVLFKNNQIIFSLKDKGNITIKNNSEIKKLYKQILTIKDKISIYKCIAIFIISYVIVSILSLIFLDYIWEELGNTIINNFTYFNKIKYTIFGDWIYVILNIFLSSLISSLIINKKSILKNKEIVGFSIGIFIIFLIRCISFSVFYRHEFFAYEILLPSIFIVLVVSIYNYIKLSENSFETRAYLEDQNEKE